jgi:phosphohistidine phosphatase
MKLYLVRHGEAVSAQVDPARPLSETGRADVEKVGRQLKSLDVQVAEVRHSTKARAAQTAEIIASVLGGARLRPMDGLAPNDPVEPVAVQLENHKADLMVVGHLPFLPALAAVLLGEATKSADTLSFPAAGVVVMSRDEDRVWSIQGQIWPEKI